MRYTFLLLLPPFMFFVFMVGARFTEFCADNDHKWWGGLPLWMAGALCGLLPAFVGGIAGIAYLVFG